MRKQTVTLLLAALCISGCSGAEQSSEVATEAAADSTAPEKLTTMDVKLDVPQEADSAAADGDASSKIPSADIKYTAPQIAYAYEYGYRVAAAEIPTLQRAHANLCQKKGPQICHMLNMSQGGSEGEYATGKLEIEVAVAQARSFADELTKIAESKGGDPVSSSIAGEDLSKQIVDTQARLRARIVLRDRLMEILQTRSGKVSELVEAERGVAEVNEEIDQAQSWLAEMKGRIAFSKMTISYNAGSPSAGGFMEPIRVVIGSVGSILGVTIAAIIGIFIFLLPWIAIIAFTLWIKRKMGWRWRFWRKDKGNAKTQDS